MRSSFSKSINGGAPNNFKLVVNQRLRAPFGSTERKGWLNKEREQEQEEYVASEQIAGQRQKYISKNRVSLLERAARFKP